MPGDPNQTVKTISCAECERELEIGYDIDFEGGECPHCHASIDADAISDALTARAEPPEWP